MRNEARKSGNFRAWAMGFLILLVFFNNPIVNPAGAESLRDAQRKVKIEALYADYEQRMHGVKSLSAEEILQLADRKDLIFVDIRKPQEQAVSMIPGAITEAEFKRNAALYRKRMIIGYCTIGYRSGKLARKLKKQNILMINMRGGILAWLHAGGTVQQDGKPVNQVHVYGKKWDLAPETITAVCCVGSF